LQERLEQLQDENEELRQQLAALQDDLEEASRQRPGTSGMSSALRQQVMTLQVGCCLAGTKCVSTYVTWHEWVLVSMPAGCGAATLQSSRLKVQTVQQPQKHHLLRA
jgi:hypothetical protein